MTDSSFLQPHLASMTPSASLRINEEIKARRAANLPVYNLGFGQSPFPVPETVVAALKEYAHEKQYPPVQGLEQLREAIAAWLERNCGMTAYPEQIIAGPGSKELLFQLQLIHKGTLLLPDPAWVSYAPQAHILQKDMVWIPTRPNDAWRLQPEVLAEYCDKNQYHRPLLLFNHPNCPTGATYTPEQLTALTEVCRQREIIVLSDEIYGPLNFAGKHRSLAEFYPEGTIVSGGLSKWCGAGGWRMGYLHFPKPLRSMLEAMLVVASETFSGVSSPIQWASISAFRPSEAIDHYVKIERLLLSALSAEVQRRLQQNDIQTVAADGAFYLFPDFAAYKTRLAKHNIHTGIEFCRAALEKTGVAMLPAEEFVDGGENSFNARLCLVDFDGTRALERLSPIIDESPISVELLEELCTPTLEGLDCLIAWVQSL